MNKVSTLESIIHQVWAEKDLNKAKTIILTHLQTSRIKSKDTIVSTVESIRTKHKLDYYVANSLLMFEGKGVSSW
jgi:hypothetical protein